MRRRTFKLSPSSVNIYNKGMARGWSRTDGDIRLRRFLYGLGFRSDLPIEQHAQFDGGIIYVQDSPENSIPTYDLVSIILLEGGFPKESVQRVLMRAWEENRDPVEIAREEVELVRKLETS